MHDYIPRAIVSKVKQYREIFPVVAILGPRQCGKTTLTKELTKEIKSSIYLDLQDPADANKLHQTDLFFENNRDKVICLDEIQLMPGLFSKLRSVVDKKRINGKFIMLGSASRDLVQRSSETLAGRIGYINLSGFTVNELVASGKFDLNRLWFRGGFPVSYLAQNDRASSIWLDNFIQTFIERDIPQLGYQIPALQMYRFLSMCAHVQGQMLNLSKLAESLSVAHTTIRRYIDLLEQTFILRTLPPFEANVKKRLVKAPKIYVRDSGILHRLLKIEDFNELLGNPVFGSSWEGLVIDNILVNMPEWNPYFFRTASGDELDLVLEKGSKRIAVECKASLSPKVTKGFNRAVDIVQPDETFIVCPINGESYPLQENVTVISLSEFCERFSEL